MPASSFVNAIFPKSAVPADVSVTVVFSGMGTPLSAVTVKVAVAFAGQSAPETAFVADSEAEPLVVYVLVIVAFVGL